MVNSDDLLQATLNGDRDHPAAPRTLDDAHFWSARG